MTGLSTFEDSSVATLSDQELLAEVERLVTDERVATVRLLVALGELEQRRLHLESGCSSLFTYCTHVLRLSEHAAYRRIQAARASRTFPIILERLASGSLTLTAVGLLAPHLTQANCQALLDESIHRTKREIEEIVARLAPKPDAPEGIRRLPVPRQAPGTGPGVEADAGRDGPGVAPAALEPIGEPPTTAPPALAAGAGPPALAPSEESSALGADVERPALGASGGPPASAPSEEPPVPAPGDRDLALSCAGFGHDRPSRVPSAASSIAGNGHAGPGTSGSVLAPSGALAVHETTVPPAPVRGGSSAAVVSVASSASPVARRERPAVVAPLAPGRYRIQFTISAGTHSKLRRVRDLMRHVVPDGNLEAVFDQAITLLLGDLERARLAAVLHRRDAAPPTAPGSRHVPAAVKRAVWARDEGRCAFVGTTGRCRETGFLQFHHREPFAVGGETTAGNLELRCAAHNAFEAELYFGQASEARARGGNKAPRAEPLLPDGPSAVRSPPPVRAAGGSADDRAPARRPPSSQGTDPGSAYATRSARQDHGPHQPAGPDDQPGRARTGKRLRWSDGRAAANRRGLPPGASLPHDEVRRLWESGARADRLERTDPPPGHHSSADRAPP